MTANGLLQIGLFFAVLVALVKPLGWYMARVYEGQPCGLDRMVGPVERVCYRLCGIHSSVEMDWKTYGIAMLLFNAVGLIALYALQRLQAVTAVESGWYERCAAGPGLQHGGEFRHQYQLASLWRRVDPELFDPDDGSDRTELCIGRNGHGHSGGSDSRTGQEKCRHDREFLVRYDAQHPLYSACRSRSSCRSCWSPRESLQTFGAYRSVPLTQTLTYDKPVTGADGQAVLDEQGKPKAEKAQLSEQLLAVGPAASQVAIKHLGTNGGGFFNANAAHPFESPTPLTDLLLVLAEAIIAASLTYTFGKMVGDTRQGWALLAAMLVVLMVFAHGGVLG